MTDDERDKIAHNRILAARNNHVVATSMYLADTDKLLVALEQAETKIRSLEDELTTALRRQQPRQGW